MAFYWFVYMMFLFGWPGERSLIIQNAPDRTTGANIPVDGVQLGSASGWACNHALHSNKP
jgi:hypothetical protein